MMEWGRKLRSFLQKKALWVENCCGTMYRTEASHKTLEESNNGRTANGWTLKFRVCAPSQNIGCVLGLLDA